MSQRVSNWMLGDKNESLIIWVDGPSGSGKSFLIKHLIFYLKTLYPQAPLIAQDYIRVEKFENNLNQLKKLKKIIFIETSYDHPKDKNIMQQNIDLFFRIYAPKEKVQFRWKSRALSIPTSHHVLPWTIFNFGLEQAMRIYDLNQSPSRKSRLPEPKYILNSTNYNSVDLKQIFSQKIDKSA